MHWITRKKSECGLTTISEIEPGYFNVFAHRRFNVRPHKIYWLNCSEAWSFSGGDPLCRLELVKSYMERLNLPWCFDPIKPSMGIGNPSDSQVTIQESRLLGVYKLVRPMQPIIDYRFR